MQFGQKLWIPRYLIHLNLIYALSAYDFIFCLKMTINP